MTFLAKTKFFFAYNVSNIDRKRTARNSTIYSIVSRSRRVAWVPKDPPPPCIKGLTEKETVCPIQGGTGGGADTPALHIFVKLLWEGTND